MNFNFAPLFYSSQDVLMKAFAMPVAIQMSIKRGPRYRYKYQCEKKCSNLQEKRQVS